MDEEDYLNNELRGILDEFTRIRDAYVALKAYCDIQEDAMAMEKERSAKLKENLEKLSRTYLLLEKRYKSSIEKLQTEKEDFRKTIEDLKEQCDHLRLINIDRNTNDEQTYRLQDEVEVLKSQLAMQEEKHNEDVAILKQQHSDEIQRYKMLLQNAKQGPSCSESKKRGGPKNVRKNKRNTPHFRWPELEVEKINESQLENGEENGYKSTGIKKRKLFHEDKETAVDIV